ncbi:MAG TPA: hypothetical protein VD995_25325 [Azospirillum sp.]|nr:hypothetical protein [Azospirillum sp.]
MSDTLVDKDMALTRADFARLLPEAAHGLPWRAEDGVYHIGGVEAGVEIRLEPLPDRRIALIALPRLRVTLAFRGWSAEERSAFLDRFDTAFRRGGG